MRPVAVFEQVEALPGAEHGPAAGNRNAERNLGQRRLDVGGHVVRAFGRVNEPRIAVRRDHVMGIGRSTRILRAITPMRSGLEALDLCSGAGWMALRLAEAGCRVTATDINDRALDFARFNARLAGHPIEFLQGDLLEPVAGRRFDLITANPPFVISPDSSYTFRDSGCRGSSFCENLARALPPYLAEGGTAVMLLTWYDDGRDEHASAPLDWTRDHEGGAWLFRTMTEEPMQYASMWLRDTAPERRADPADIRRWVEYFASLGAARLHTGFLILHRDGGPRWTRSDVRQFDRLRVDAGEDVRRVLDGESWLARHQPDDEALLDQRFSVPDGVRAETVSELDADWQAVAIRLVSPGRLAYDGPVDAFLLRLVAHCRGGAPARPLLDEMAGTPGLPPAGELRNRVAGIVRELVRHGILLPP